eukprot:COSAG02_NODE_538_length_20609_cov_7.009703_13_plen_175_part_00
MTRELLGRVSKASQELFGQNAGLRALRMFETKTEELLRPESSWDERNPCQRARVSELRTGLIRVQTVFEFSVKWRIMNRLHDQIMTHIQLTGIPSRSAQASRARFSRSLELHAAAQNRKALGRTGGTRIRNGLFWGGWITPVLGVCRYSDRSHFEATAAADPTSEGFRLEFPYA